MTQVGVRVVESRLGGQGDGVSVVNEVSKPLAHVIKTGTIGIVRIGNLPWFCSVRKENNSAKLNHSDETCQWQ